MPGNIVGHQRALLRADGISKAMEENPQTIRCQLSIVQPLKPEFK
jgi:hypothetical protein